ncbi:hypothetical protein BDA96_04G274900 [Sorghum bicolor]|uniref:Uncharacterized protein n=2 Tax=Sorghum bicolor TaxID=4558 RepID=A0A921R6A7_SORBI|nr:hypothetical protein BDA96_04G274900 [Sorghum bicolor]KXG30870.1 hypothetical protein SORBI_3004G257900 [Sorghum bicolor]
MLHFTIYKQYEGKKYRFLSLRLYFVPIPCKVQVQVVTRTNKWYEQGCHMKLAVMGSLCRICQACHCTVQ